MHNLAGKRSLGRVLLLDRSPTNILSITSGRALLPVPGRRKPSGPCRCNKCTQLIKTDRLSWIIDLHTKILLRLEAH